MMRAVVAFLLCVLLSSAAVAQKRVALVVGNSAYQSTPALINPRNDATDMAAALKKLGFQVVEGFDLDKASFDRKVRDFADTLSGAKVGVFFYAGHGLQVTGHNYLVPIDAKLSTASALDWEMVRMDLVQRTMERETETNLLFLDACRDNPLARNLARAMGTRSAEIGRGLAATEAGVGTLISFSTQPGNVALDGSGRNSPFAGALVKRVGASNDDLSALLIDVRNDVRKETKNKQVPWEHSALTGRFYFNPSAQMASPPAVAPARLSEAAEAWDRTKDTADPAVLDAFNARYKDTFYADLARARIEELSKGKAELKRREQEQKKQQEAAAPPAVKPPTSDPPRSLFDGMWTIHRVGPGCPNPDTTFSIMIDNSVANGRQGGGPIKGSVSEAGVLSFSHPRSGNPRQTVDYSGKLLGEAGKGSFKSVGSCHGAFTAKRPQP